MQTTSLHNPDRYMADLRQILSQGRKRIGILIGAGAPTAIRVDEHNQITEDEGRPLIPDVAGLTDAVVSALNEHDQRIIGVLKNENDKCVNIEDILTQIRRLSQAIGSSTVHDLNGNQYEELRQRICAKIGENVNSRLTDDPNPFSELVSWISGTQREYSVEVFTPNYDLLLEEAFERAKIAYFDGFTGSRSPFFDPASVSLSDELPARWARLWKLHGSLGWKISSGKAVSEKAVVRTGQRNDTELIYPDHLKYDLITRLPYSALFERLRHFLTTPDTLLMCSGFSFQDAHICAVLDEALSANAHSAILAFQYRTLEEEKSAVTLTRRPNMSVYARDGAVISGVAGRWQLGQPPNEEWEEIRRTFWGRASPDVPTGFLLGDFAKLAQFLALTQARMIMTPMPSQAQEDDEVSDGAPEPEESHDAQS